MRWVPGYGQEYKVLLKIVPDTRLPMYALNSAGQLVLEPCKAQIGTGAEGSIKGLPNPVVRQLLLYGLSQVRGSGTVR